MDRALEAFQEVVRLDPQQPLRAASTCRSCTRSSTSGPRRCTCASRSRGSMRRRQPDDQPILGLPAQRDRRAQARAGDSGGGRHASPSAPSRSTRGTAPAYLNLGDVRERQGNLAGRDRRLGAADVEAVPTARYLAFDRLERAYARSGTPRRFVELCQRLIAPQPAGLARPPGAVAPPRGRRRSTARRSTCCSTRCPTTRTASPSTRRSGRCSRRSAFDAHPGPPLHRPDARRGLLSRSARLPALPLPQHRAAVAVPAVPRVEHVRRGTHRAGEGHGAGGDERIRSMGSARDARCPLLNGYAGSMPGMIRRLAPVRAPCQPERGGQATSIARRLPPRGIVRRIDVGR